MPLATLPATTSHPAGPARMPPLLETSTAAAPQAVAVPRLHFLDALRILAFGWLIVYHVGMYYASWPWHVKSALASQAIEPWLRLSAPWRMDLLFLISGVATAAQLSRTAVDGRWLRQRSGRLLAPLLLGVLLIVPPQSWREVVQQHGYAGGYLDFLRLYLSGFRGFCRADGGCLILPTWNHLWYLAYLASYTALVWLLLRAAPGCLSRAGAWMARPRGAAWRLLVLPMAWLALARWMLQARFPDTHALIDDWNTHAHHGALFLAGLAFAAQGAIWQRFEAWRWPALALALAGWALQVGLQPPWGEQPALPRALRLLPYVLQQWMAIVAALGFARHHLDRDSAWRRQLGEGVFPIYLLHQTLIVLLAVALAPLALPMALEAPLLIALTAALGWVAWRALRHSGPLRPWVGLPR